MNQGVIDAIEHWGASLTVLPGDGFVGLSGKTAATYLQDDDGVTAWLLLETAPGEPLDEVADFFAQQALLACHPSETMAEWGVEPCSDPVRVRFFLDAVSDDVRKMIVTMFTQRLSEGRLCDQ